MSRARQLILLGGALLAAAAVALGAFGAHALRDALDPEALGWWQTAVHYQMWHALALLGLAALPLDRPGVPALLLGLGAALFAATLYLMALTGARWLGAVAPLGGATMVAGWLLLAWRARTIGGAD